jgi:pyridoxal biosynthesis lyase PdxS
MIHLNLSLWERSVLLVALQDKVKEIRKEAKVARKAKATKLADIMEESYIPALKKIINQITKQK